MLKKILISTTVIASLMSLSGCAALIKANADQNCNAKSAYNNGYNDAMQSMPEDSNYFNSNSCGLDRSGSKMALFNRRYRIGYNKGKIQLWHNKHHHHNQISSGGYMATAPA